MSELGICIRCVTRKRNGPDGLCNICRAEDVARQLSGHLQKILDVRHPDVEAFHTALNSYVDAKIAAAMGRMGELMKQGREISP